MSEGTKITNDRHTQILSKSTESIKVELKSKDQSIFVEDMDGRVLKVDVKHIKKHA